MRIWNGSIKSSARAPISRKPCDDWRFRKGEPPARQGHWAYPRSGASGKTRPLGIPSVYDRVCQQALVNRLEPIFEKVFDPSSFGYRKGRKTADALAKIW